MERNLYQCFCNIWNCQIRDELLYAQSWKYFASLFLQTITHPAIPCFFLFFFYYGVQSQPFYTSLKHFFYSHLSLGYLFLLFIISCMIFLAVNFFLMTQTMKTHLSPQLLFPSITIPCAIKVVTYRYCTYLQPFIQQRGRLTLRQASQMTK